jgi:heme exporter protein C
MSWAWLHRFGSPPYFYAVAKRLTPWFAWPAALLIAGGLYGALVASPADYQQSDAYRIMYVHAPGAWLSLMAYSYMAIAAAIGLVWRIKVAHAVAAGCATVGASFTAVSLLTGMLWGQPMWGTYWEWDPRLVFQLVLLFFFVAYVALRSAIDDTARADRASAVLAIVGAVNVPIVHYSVIWWNSLHQAPSLMRLDKPAMPASMWVPLVMMFLGFTCYFIAIMLTRSRAEILRRERGGTWVKEMLAAGERK